MTLILCHVLIIGSLFYASDGQKQGCADWNLHGNDVCCVKCHPGNRLVEECGKDPSKLCKPCEPGTFISNPMKPYCDRCTKCIGPQFEKQACTISSDTVCGCKTGLRCGNQQCSYCVDECREGQEPTNKRTCQTCPEGTFNNQIHSKCKPRKTSCPKGEKLVATGDAFNDNKCIKEPERFTFAPTPKINEFNTVENLLSKKKENDDPFWPLVGFTGVFAVATVAVILALWFAFQKTKNKTNSDETETKDQMPETLPPEELRVMIVRQDDACSYRQPEQEQGGSSESINTQDSESKLII